VWSREEVTAILGPEDGELFCRIYGIVPPGNFEGKSIPNLLEGGLAERAAELGTTEEDLARRLAPLRARLLAAREERVRPGTDDKVLAAWNGLMITAFARAYQAFGREEDLVSAARAAAFVLEEMVEDGRLHASHRAGTTQLNAYLDDHAFLARGLLDVYESSFDRAHLDAAVRLARAMVERFQDRAGGGFFFTSSDHEKLLTRSRSQYDGALPAGSAVAVEVLLRLAVHLDDASLENAALAALKSLAPLTGKAPTAFTSLLAAADFREGPVLEIAVVGDPADETTRSLLGAIRGRYLPNRVVALSRPGGPTDGLPLLTGKSLLRGRPAAYVCRNYACKTPTSDPLSLAKSLGG
jgi:uncharacterized protein YyaL (SSP411 family)